MHTITGTSSLIDESYPDQLRDDGGGFCQGPQLFDNPDGVPDPHFHDNSAYWIPALYPDTSKTPGDEIDPSSVLIYYRNAMIPPASVEAFPDDLAMIAGDKMATSAQPAAAVVWSCVSEKTDHESMELNFGQEIPDWCPNDTGYPNYDPFYLRLVVKFPDCIREDQPESHQQLQVLPPNVFSLPDTFAGATGAYALWTSPQHSAKSCSPYGNKWHAIPQLQVGFRWALNADNASQETVGGDLAWDLTQFTLASDHMEMSGGGYSGDHGVTAHADFLNGWDPADFTALMHGCFGVGTGGTIQNCGVIGGDGN